MPDVCLIVPCFNEAERLRSADFLAHLDAEPRSSFCFVNDGSTDRTAAVLEALAAQRADRITVLPLAQNRGKAEAVRQGMQHVARSGGIATVGYWDADLATPLSELAAMLATLDANPGCQMVLGSRWRRLGSNIERRAVRHALGRVFATAASLILDLPVYDSQCGAKLFRASIVDALFTEPFATRWLFDVEVLARLRNARGRQPFQQSAIEVPLTRWHDVGGSRMRWSHMAAAPAGLLAIHRRYRQR